MNHKSILLKKVALVFSLIFLLTIEIKLNAQIIYTDIPDATPSATYPLDLNNDMTTDFLIQFDLGFKIMCKPQNNNAYSGELVGGEYLPWALSQSIWICDTLLTWYGASNPGTMAWDTTIGHWPGAVDKYLPLKLVVGANTYYGWARLDVLANSGSFTVKDYAYESTPNACILSGQTPLGIVDISTQNTISIQPNPFHSSTIIQIKDNLKNGSMTLYNAYGQIVKQLNNLTGKSISINKDNLPSGVYFIRLTDENHLMTIEKVVIADNP